MAKYRKLQQEMEGAVERADMAENTLGQLRARNRSASVAPESTTTFGLTVWTMQFFSTRRTRIATLPFDAHANATHLHMYSLGQKSGATDSWSQFCQIWADFKKSLEDSLVNLQLNGY